VERPGVVHGRYFKYPDDTGPDDMATVLQSTLQFAIDDRLEDLLDAPDPLPETDPKPTPRGG